MDQGDAPDPQQRSTSPLVNPSFVLERIFEYLPPKDLQSCRVVCRFWDEEASPLLSSRSLLEFTPELCQSAPDFWPKVCSRSTPNLLVSVADIKDENLKVLLDKYGNIIKSLELDVETENLSVVQCGTDLQSIVELCPRLQEMTLLYESSERNKDKNFEEPDLENEEDVEEKDSDSEYQDIETVEPNLESIEPEGPLDLQDLYTQMEQEIGPFPPQFEGLKANGCPSLKRLTLSLSIFIQHWTLGAEYFTNVFDFAPNVEDLSIRLYCIHQVATDDAIKALETRPDFVKKLKSLTFGKSFGATGCGESPTLTLENIRTLLSLKFDCLQRLDIELILPYFSEPGNNLAEIFQLLDDVSETLKHLRMGFFLCKLTTDFPWMPKLEELVLSYGHVNAKFFAKCPNLVKVVVEQMESFNTTIENTLPHVDQWFEEVGNPIFLKSLRDTKESGLVHGSLKQLEILNIPFAPNDFQSLDCFPALNILKIKLGTNSLHSVINELSSTTIMKLELTFAPEENDFETALTGLNVAECESFEATRAFLSESDFKLRTAGTFSDWKCLRKLSLINCGAEAHLITGVAACQGFGRMNITSLKLEKFEISDVNLLIMLKRMSLSALNFRKCAVLPTIWGESDVTKKFVEMFPRIHISIA